MSLLCRVGLACLTFLFVAHVPQAQGENWPQWRGPRLDGVSLEKDLPERWSRTENVVWRLPMPGPAGATPVVWEDRIYLTSVDADGKLLLLCVSTQGDKLWERAVDQGNRNARGDEGNSASPSPCTDGQHVWALMGTGMMACYSKEGQEVWKLDLQQRYGKLNIQFGYSSTPVLDRGRLYLQLIHGDGSAETQEARLFCLDAATGSEIWKTARDTGASRENEHSYASPTIYRDDKQEYLISHGGDYVMANSLSDGSELWRYCLNPQGALYHPTLRFVSSPLATPGLIVAPSAKKGPIVCIKPEARGDISQNSQALHWRWDKGTPDVPSPLFHDGLIYLCLEDGILFCIDAETGAMLYQHRTTPDRHRASPVYADGKLYVTARNGTVDVVRAGSEFELLAKNDLGEPTSASPVISNGRIYLRTFDALYAIGKK